MRSKLAMTAAAIGASLFLITATAPAQAQWRSHGGGWRHGGGWGGAAAGFAAGAIVGSAVGAGGYYYGPYGYGYSGYYGPDYAYDSPSYGGRYGYADSGYGPYASDDTYGYDGYAQGGGAYASGDGASYCAQRYRSYNPATGTYLGFDGLRHSCP